MTFALHHVKGRLGACLDVARVGGQALASRWDGWKGGGGPPGKVGIGGGPPGRGWCGVGPPG